MIKNFILSLFVGLCIYFSQFLIIYNYGVNIPYWDQWYSETELYLLYETNSLNFEYLISPHNEHRIFFTRIFNLFIYIILGGWNPKIGMFIQAIIPTIIAFLLSLFFNQYVRKNIILLFHNLLIISVFGLPYFWENILWSFQNQHYFMVLFGITSHLLYINKSSKTSMLIIGIFQFSILFTVASGVLAIITCIILSGIKIFKDFANKRYWIYLIFFQIMLVLLQLKLWVKVPLHEQLKADTFYSFFIEFLNVLSWPIITFSSGYLLIWGVLILFIISQIFIFSKMRNKIFFLYNEIYVTLILLIWGLIQEIAISYSRTFANVYSSRYLLTYGVILIFISQSIILLFRRNQMKLYYIMFIPLIFILGVINFNYEITRKDLIERYNFQIEARKSIIFFVNQKDTDYNKISSFVCPSKLHVKNILENKELKNKHLWIKND